MGSMIEELEKAAARIDSDRDNAVEAMASLARAYASGENCPVDLGKAYEWAVKAVEQNSADGYLEYAKILGSACIATGEPPLKIEYAENICTVCDVLTVTRFERPDIACAVATVCEYMADYGRVNSAPENFVEPFRKRAQAYYLLAALNDNPEHKETRQIAQGGLERVAAQQTAERPVFRPGAIMPYFGVS